MMRQAPSLALLIAILGAVAVAAGEPPSTAQTSPAQVSAEREPATAPSAATTAPRPETAPSRPAAVPAYQDAFEAGRFAAAAASAEGAVAADPSAREAWTVLGKVRLLENHAAAAADCFTKALAFAGEDRDLRELLAEAYVRQDRFPDAAPLLRALGREAAARQLESFGTRTPYRVTAFPGGEVHLDFLATDPLPLVSLRVNGQQGSFIIDTGGAELILDPDFAARAGATRFGEDVGTFAGGKKAPYAFGSVAAVELGGARVEDVPVHLLPTGRFSAVFGGKAVDGILGTLLLARFRFTLDYPRGRLVLTPRDREPGPPPSGAKTLAKIPLWWAGDHYLLANGTVNGGAPQLFFIDTGLAGLGFTAPESTLTTAGIATAAAGTGSGGGGRVAVQPFVADELSLGDAHRRQVPGVAGPFPPQLEHRFGFRIGGLISHAFFRPYAATFDLRRLRLTLVER